MTSLFGSKPSCTCDLGTRIFFGGGPSWKATGLQLQSAYSWFVWWQTKATATTAIWELKFWVVGPVGKCASTAIWVLLVFLSGWADPVRLQCETWVFLAAGTWELLVNDLVHLAFRPANVCPRVLRCCLWKWDGVRWSGMFPWFRLLGCLYVVKWMGSSTRLFSIDMNVEVSTSVVRWFVGGFSPWAHCYFVEVQYWEESEWPASFTCCLAVFVISPLRSRMTLSFV